MTKSSGLSKDMIKQLDIMDRDYEAAGERSRFIRIALNFNRELDAIPEWDHHSRDMLYECMDPQVTLALEYIAENEIDLSNYSLEVGPTEAIVDQSRVESIKLSKLLIKYLKIKKTNNLAETSLISYKNNINLFIDVMKIKGISTTQALKRSHIEYYIEALQKIPTNRKKLKEFRDIPLEKLLSMEIDESKLLAGSTCQSGATNVKAFLDWGTKNEHLNDKISVPLEDAFKNAVSHSYVSFTNADLKLLFHSVEYLKGKHKKSAHYWVPLLALYTGARSNEICQLYVQDIKEEPSTINSKSIPYIDINIEGTKSLKTIGSRRKIPIHPTLISLGFLVFVESQRQKKLEILFNDLKIKSGKRGNSFSDWFNQTYRPKCKIESIKPDKRKVFHSFRHTLTQNLRRNSETPLDKIAEIIGHSSKTTIGKHYAGVLSLEAKLKVIKKAKYDIDLKIIRKWNNSKQQYREEDLAPFS